ncbi:hypothetical protein MK805_00665 [Shimazuella sp. AN120528]|uniref:hypothetical protein n=1 Tax=Shimazuella soli TaxID=1892854 RepID=UPI001F10C2A7|nr:hypothetical protein [Shimazuella soli]MCH5583484.1 hypothetical protein [Shimazuella soli]
MSGLISREQFDFRLEKRVDDESLVLSGNKRWIVYGLYPALIASTGMLDVRSLQSAVVYLVAILLAMFIMAWHKGVNRLSYLRQLSIAWMLGSVPFYPGWVQVATSLVSGLLYLFNGEWIGEKLGKLNSVLKYTGALIALLPVLLLLAWKTGTMFFAALIVLALFFGLDVIIAVVIVRWARCRRIPKVEKV